MIAALNKAGEELVIPDTLKIRMITEEAFDNLLKADAGKTYDNYGTIAKDLIGTKVEDKPLTAAETDRLQRERLNDMLGEVARVLEKINGESDSDDDDDDASAQGSTKMVTPVMSEDETVRVATAVAHIAKTIEENVRKVVTAAAAAPESSTTPGSATIKQVRRASGKMLAAKSVASPPKPI